MAVALPACGGEDEPPASKPAAGSVAPDQFKGMEKRVGELEKEVDTLRKDLESERDEQSSNDDPPADDWLALSTRAGTKRDRYRAG